MASTEPRPEILTYFGAPGLPLAVHFEYAVASLDAGERERASGTRWLERESAFRTLGWGCFVPRRAQHGVAQGDTSARAHAAHRADAVTLEPHGGEFVGDRVDDELVDRPCRLGVPIQVLGG